MKTFTALTRYSAFVFKGETQELIVIKVQVIQIDSPGPEEEVIENYRPDDE